MLECRPDEIQKYAEPVLEHLRPCFSCLPCGRASPSRFPLKSGRGSEKRKLRYSIVITVKIRIHNTIQYNILLHIFIGFYNTNSDIT
jgi:hypothetical protein